MEETIKEQDELIDKTDNVAAIEVALLPDNMLTQKGMHRYGYTWDGMLPLRSRTAKRLLDMGMQVYSLHSDNTETKITDFEQISADGIYGIEKPVWNNYLSTKEADAYFAARMIVANAVGEVINDELNYVDCKYADPLSDINFDERTALENYMSSKETPAEETLKPYLPELLTEYSDFISQIPLEHYGWFGDDLVPRTIAEHIASKLLREYAEVLTRDTRYEYDSDGNKTHFRDSDGYEEWWDYENGKMTHYHDSKGYENWSEYDKNGNETHYKNIEGFERWCEFDENGNLTKDHVHNRDGTESWSEYNEKVKITKKHEMNRGASLTSTAL